MKNRFRFLGIGVAAAQISAMTMLPALALQPYEWIARKDLWSPVEILRQASGMAGELLALSEQWNPYSDCKLIAIE